MCGGYRCSCLEIGEDGTFRYWGVGEASSGGDRGAWRIASDQCLTLEPDFTRVGGTSMSWCLGRKDKRVLVWSELSSEYDAVVDDSSACGKGARALDRLINELPE